MFIYALKLGNGKYYIGRTNNFNERLRQHKNGDGSEWTTLHKHVDVVETVKTSDPFDEDKYVLKYMKKYGIDNVRGGSFSKIKPTKEEEEHFKKMLRNANDSCYKCGKSGHFASNCYVKIRQKTTSSKPKVTCYRCGKPGHTSPNCYVDSDSDSETDSDSDLDAMYYR